VEVVDEHPGKQRALGLAVLDEGSDDLRWVARHGSGPQRIMAPRDDLGVEGAQHVGVACRGDVRRQWCAKPLQPFDDGPLPRELTAPDRGQEHRRPTVGVGKDAGLDSQLVWSVMQDLVELCPDVGGLGPGVDDEPGEDLRDRMKSDVQCCRNTEVTPPPRSAQYSSGSDVGLAVTWRPSARTTSALSRLSSARPKRPLSGP
jgi:hypothetical protein